MGPRMSETRPGSAIARAKGCTCPRDENDNGRGWGRDPETGDPLFVMRLDCPLHGRTLFIGKETANARHPIF